MAGHLYVVGTPIGNLADLSDRARETLATVDLIAAEDTRRTGRLLEHIGVKVRMLSLFEGNERQRIDELLDRLREGKRVALVSDAGMPAVSDPGFRLLRAAADAGIQISRAARATGASGSERSPTIRGPSSCSSLLCA
jgi:16S rRNA (cytidine1402-2'-O)-methyltransferase